MENGNEDDKFGLRPGLRVDVFNYHDRSRIRLVILWCIDRGTYFLFYGDTSTSWIQKENTETKLDVLLIENMQYDLHNLIIHQQRIQKQTSRVCRHEMTFDTIVID